MNRIVFSGWSWADHGRCWGHLGGLWSHVGEVLGFLSRPAMPAKLLSKDKPKSYVCPLVFRSSFGRPPALSRSHFLSPSLFSSLFTLFRARFSLTACGGSLPSGSLLRRSWAHLGAMLGSLGAVSARSICHGGNCLACGVRSRSRNRPPWIL